MSKTAPGIFILRTLAIVMALAALTAYVVVRSRSAGKEKQRTRASSSKSQTIASAFAAAKAAGAELETRPAPPADLESIFGSGFKTKYLPENDGTHFSGTKSGLLLSPTELSEIWPTLESLHIPWPDEPLPPALQTTDSPR